MKILIITNIPSPYRFPLFDEIAKNENVELFVIYTGEYLKNFEWHKPKLAHKHLFLKIPRIKILTKLGYRHGILKILKQFSPEAIITGGFNYTMLIAILYAHVKSIKHYVTTDAWEFTEQNYSFIHILIRKIVYRKATGFFPVSIKGKMNIVKKYKINEAKIHIVSYTPNITNFHTIDFQKKDFDILFSGQFIERKMPLFVCEIVKELKKRGINVNVLLLGKGALVNDVISFLNNEKISYKYQGFVQPAELPYFITKAKLFLFPSLSDGWGVVANEALASGLPVITCENTGVAGELIINNFNGFVLPLQINEWVEHIQILLNNPVLYEDFSTNALAHIGNFSIQKATQNFINALI